MAEAEDTVVDECVELPYPPAEPSLVQQVVRLGIEVGDAPSKPECVFEILRWCIHHRRVARIVYHTDVQGNPWRPDVEPHGFRRSRDGFRVRCYLPPRDDEPEVVSDYQTTGWHLYLVSCHCRR